MVTGFGFLASRFESLELRRTNQWYAFPGGELFLYDSGKRFFFSRANSHVAAEHCGCGDDNSCPDCQQLNSIGTGGDGIRHDVGGYGRCNPVHLGG
jgi:hypothetical protein